MKKQRILSFLLVLCMTVSLLSTAAFAVDVKSFTDVSSDEWYYEYVDFVTSKGYFIGTSDTTFEPDLSMTRAMFVTVLARLDEAEIDDNVNPFPDVEAGTWYSGSVKWAADRQIVIGRDTGLFDPEAPITREEMCTIMDRFITYYSAKTEQTHEKDGSTEPFPDAASISDYAKEAVANCRAYGLVEGFPDGKFYPAENSTRAQVAAVINRLAWVVNPEEPDEPGPVGPGPNPSVTYTLTYDANGGAFANGAAAKSFSQADNDTFTVISEEPTREGYVFLGWSYYPDGGVYWKAGDPVLIGTEDTIYAVWIADNDYIGLAVSKTIDQVNERYLNGAYIDVNDLVGGYIYPMYFNTETLEDNDDVRPQCVGSLVYVTDDLVAEIIETAADAAVAIIPDLTLAQVKEVVRSIVDALQDADISQDTVNEIADSVYDQAVAEAQGLWANFRDGEGNYYTGDVTISVGSASYTVTVDQASGTTTFSGSKKEAAKSIGSALAREMYASLRENTEWTSVVYLSGTVTFDFANGEVYGDVTEPYPNVYPVEIGLFLYGEDLIEYKFDGTSCLKLRITEDIQNQYSADVERVIVAALENDGVLTELEGRVQSALSANAVIDALHDELDAEAFNALLTAAVEEWVAANTVIQPRTRAVPNYYLPFEFFWTNEGELVYDAESDTYTLVIGGEAADKQVLGDNAALYGLIVDLCGELADEVIAEAETAQPIEGEDVTVAELASYIIDETENTVIKGYTVRTLADSVIAEARTALADDYGEAWETMPADEQNSFLFSSIKLTINGGDYNDVPQAVRNYLINLCGNKLQRGSAFEGFTVDGLVYEVIKAALADDTYADIPASLRSYLEKLCGVELGFESADEYTVEGLTYEAIKVALDDAEYADIPAAARSYLLEVCGVRLGQVEAIDADVTAEVNALIDQMVCKTFVGYDRYLELAVKAKELKTLANVQLGNLATLLNNATFQSYVTQYGGEGTRVVNALAKVINALPAGASVTLNGVTLNAATLNGVKAAANLTEVCTALADVINTPGLRDLSVSSFADGMDITVRYNSRTFTFNLTVEVE